MLLLLLCLILSIVTSGIAACPNYLEFGNDEDECYGAFNSGHASSALKVKSFNQVLCHNAMT